MGLNRRIKNGSILIAVLVIMLVICQGARCRETNNNETKAVLGKYNNLEVYQEKIIVEESVLQAELKHILIKYATFKETKSEKIKNGDIVTVEFVKTGEGESENREIYVGQNEVSKEIDEGLLGMKINEKKNVTMYDENYEMKVIKIQNVIFPKLENSFVKKEFGVSSTKKYMEKLKRNIYNTKYNMEVERVKGELMNIVINNSSITCSEKEMEEQFKELKQSYEKYAELYGMSYIETLEKFGTNDKKMKKQ